MHKLQSESNAEYNRVHYYAGKLRALLCCHCGSPNDLQSALSPDTPEDRLRVNSITGFKYSISPADYITLCRICHKRMDGRHRTHCPRGHEYTPDNLVKIRNGHKRCAACHREKEAIRQRRPEVQEKIKAYRKAYAAAHVSTPESRARAAANARARRAKKRLNEL